MGAAAVAAARAVNYVGAGTVEFLLDRDGNVVERFSPMTTPEDLREKVVALL